MKPEFYQIKADQKLNLISVLREINASRFLYFIQLGVVFKICLQTLPVFPTLPTPKICKEKFVLSKHPSFYPNIDCVCLLELRVICNVFLFHQVSFFLLLSHPGVSVLPSCSPVFLHVHLISADTASKTVNSGAEGVEYKHTLVFVMLIYDNI